MKIVTFEGGCSSKGKIVGFQFQQKGDDFLLGGSFILNDSDTAVSAASRECNGRFLHGQGFAVRGCRLCGNKHVYQCARCGGFVCYDGKEISDAVCPVCGTVAAVAATTDARIVRSNPTPPLKILMVFDTSMSMEGMRLHTTKRAAVQNLVRAFPSASFAVVSFGTRVRTVLDFTKDVDAVERAIDGLYAEGGTTSPFRHIKENFDTFLHESVAKRYIVLLTDGEWAGQRDGNIASGKEILSSGVQVMTIGCAEADMRFLTAVSSPDAAIDATSSDDEVVSAYATAATKITQ